jgi:polysaccharide biosynthesis protein PslH
MSNVKRPRILFVSQIVPYPPHGGVLQRGFNMLRELSQHCDIHLLAFHHADELPLGAAYTESLEQLSRFCTGLEYFPLWIKRRPANKRLLLAAAAFMPRPYSVLAHYSIRLSRRIRFLCAGDDPPDIVHLDTIGLAPYAHHCRHLPRVLAHHNVESELMYRRASAERSALARAYVLAQARRLAEYERVACGAFDLNVTVSDLDASQLQRISPGIRTTVIPNGVDTDYFTPHDDPGAPVLVFAGGMNMFANRDGIEWFVADVWPLVKCRSPEARIVVVGGSPSAVLLQAASADPSIQVTGYVPDVRPFTRSAAVYVVPLRVGGGTRLKVLDAMAQGKAIVSTRLGAEGISARDGEHLLLADTADSFADSVVSLLFDPARRALLGAAGRRLAEDRYAWPLIGATLARDYARLLAERRSIG